MSSILAIDGGTPVRENFLPFGIPCLGEEENNEVIDTMNSGWIGTGPKTIRFEKMLANYIDVPHAVAVNSCTAGLFLSLLVSDIKSGDEVITTPLTFAATANVIEHCGAKPVFVDIDPITLNIDPAKIKQAITSRTRAILPVHFGGLACDLDAINKIAQDNQLIVIEDAAHAIGTCYKGRMIGSFGNLTSFSFYPNKNMTTIEGGAITTDNSKLAEQLEIYRLHGLSRHAWQRYTSHRLILSDAIVPGYKFNMTDIQASLGIPQLNKLESFIEIRAQYAMIYDDAFAQLEGIRMQPRPTNPEDRHALHLYVLIISPDHFRVSRNQIIDALLAENIGAALHYRALHTHPFYANSYGYQLEDFPHAAEVGENIFSLPLSPKMTKDDVENVITAVLKVLRAYQK